MRGCTFHPMSSREAMVPLAPMVTAPLGILPPSPLTSSATVTSSVTDLNGSFININFLLLS